MIATLEQPSSRDSAFRDQKIGLHVASLERRQQELRRLRSLRGVNFACAPEKSLRLLGPNGAGKTTAVKLLRDCCRPTPARHEFLGATPANPENRMRTGAMLQVGQVPKPCAFASISIFFPAITQSRCRRLKSCGAAGLEKLRDRKFGDLSGGQKQRVLFALAICGDPDLLFLDEPTVGLDVEARRLLWDEIRSMVDRGKTVLLTTPLFTGGGRARRPRSPFSIKAKLSRKEHPRKSRRKPRASAFAVLPASSLNTLRQIPGVSES